MGGDSMGASHTRIALFSITRTWFGSILIVGTGDPTKKQDEGKASHEQ